VPRFGENACHPTRGIYGITWNCLLLVSVPFGVVTVTNPVVAPTGTVLSIAVSERIVNDADTPLTETLVVPVSPWPRVPNSVPTLQHSVMSDRARLQVRKPNLAQAPGSSLHQAVYFGFRNTTNLSAEAESVRSPRSRAPSPLKSAAAKYECPLPL